MLLMQACCDNVYISFLSSYLRNSGENLIELRRQASEVWYYCQVCTRYTPIYTVVVIHT
jgi:hypothetical protein